MGSALIHSRASIAPGRGNVLVRVGATYNTRGQGGANAGVGFAFQADGKDRTVRCGRRKSGSAVAATRSLPLRTVI